jgi:hypothetical protein
VRQASPVLSGALSSVSTTPTFNPADYGPPSSVVSAPTVDENKVIQDYVNATMASNPNDWVNIVAQRMDEVGVSPSRLQQAFPDLSVEQIQQSYEKQDQLESTQHPQKQSRSTKTLRLHRLVTLRRSTSIRIYIQSNQRRHLMQASSLVR